MNNPTIIHKMNSTNKIKFSIITLSDSRRLLSEDISGNIIASALEKKYKLISRTLIPDESKELLNTIKKFTETADVIITTGGTGLSQRDITVETVETIYEKKIDGFGELFRLISYEKIGPSAMLSRATAGIYNKSIIFSLPGSPNAVKTAMNIIIDEIPHLVHHVIH